jgi:hypothetical protein
MSLTSHTSFEAVATSRTPSWPMALLAPATGSPQEVAGHLARPLLMFY